MSAAGTDERIACMRLARTDSVGPTTYRRLMRRYPSAADALLALPQLARAGGGKAPRLLDRALAEREFERAVKAGATILFVDDPGYPPLLGLLHDAPPVIAVLGDPARLSGAAIAIVGSRNASANGQNIAESLASALAPQLAVVSGLARGIDAAAHLGALRTGITIAAVAGGLDQPYPPGHAELQGRIAERGAVLTEAPFGTVPQARHFPRRNRVIAGLALGVVVIEAALRSGSLITARLALENGRELFAVPGSPLDPRSRGANDLIRQGAHLTETAEDVIANLPVHPDRIGIARVPLFARPLDADPPLPHMAEPCPHWPDEQATDRTRAQVESLLSHTPTSVDDLVDRCQVSPAAINVILLELELAGRVDFLPGQRVALAAAPEDRAEP